MWALLPLLLLVLCCPSRAPAPGPAPAPASHYAVLQVDADATVPEIRKAYRRLALRLHPDKQGSRGTAEFQRLGRAYQVLVDEEKRANYDLYGEEDPYLAPGGWRIDVRYNLDDIWELSEGRFEPFVVQAPELWLVKFMAPWQQECRALIPLWNKLARLLKGVVRVGVVDCQRYWALCERYQARPVPALLSFYGGRHEVFRDAHTIPALAAFVMATLTAPVHAVHQSPFPDNKPWLLYFTLSEGCVRCEKRLQEVKKAAILLAGLVNVGVCQCDRRSETAVLDAAGQVLSSLAVTYNVSHHPTLIWAANASYWEEYTGHPLGHSIDAYVVERLPDVVHKVGPRKMANSVLPSRAGWLLCFVDETSHYWALLWPEYRKAALLLLGTAKVGLVRCAKHRALCTEWRFQSYPRLAWLPKGLKGLAKQQAAVDYAGDWFGPELSRWVQDRRAM
eukprot:EG_transcript_9043